MIYIKLTEADGTAYLYKKSDDVPYSIYEHIAMVLSEDISKISRGNHMIAADAEGWCEIACIGEHYDIQGLPGWSLDIVEA